MAEPRQGIMPHAMPFHRGLPLTSPYRHLSGAQDGAAVQSCCELGFHARGRRGAAGWERCPVRAPEARPLRRCCWPGAPRGHACTPPAAACWALQSHMRPMAVTHSRTEEVCTAQVGRLSALDGSAWISNAAAGPAAALSSSKAAAATAGLADRCSVVIRAAPAAVSLLLRSPSSADAADPLW